MASKGALIPECDLFRVGSWRLCTNTFISAGTLDYHKPETREDIKLCA